MIVVRFKVQCQPGTADQAMAAFRDCIAPSRQVDGVVHFDIGRALDDPDVFIATEVFDDRASLERQESQAVVQNTIKLLEQILAAAPEATIYHVSSSEPHGG